MSIIVLREKILVVPTEGKVKTILTEGVFNIKEVFLWISRLYQDDF